MEVIINDLPDGIVKFMTYDGTDTGTIAYGSSDKLNVIFMATELARALNLSETDIKRVIDSGLIWEVKRLQTEVSAMKVLEDEMKNEDIRSTYVQLPKKQLLTFSVLCLLDLESVNMTMVFHMDRARDANHRYFIYLVDQTKPGISKKFLPERLVRKKEKKAYTVPVIKVHDKNHPLEKEEIH